MVMKVLAGPWVGEFGWELMCWQAYLRSMKDVFGYDDLICFTRPGRELMYEDFAKVESFSGIPSQGADMEKMNGYSFANFLTYAKRKYEDYKIILPFHLLYHGHPVSINGSEIVAKFNPLGQDTKNSKYTVLLHARLRTHRSDKNWSMDNWKHLSDKLCSDNIDFAFVGSLKEAICPEGCNDLRGTPLRDEVGYYAGAKCLVGPMSGPMHLATLSKCPQLVWSGDDYNEMRLKKEWNPFEVHVTYMGNNSGGWNPTVESVYNNIKKLV